MSKYKSLEHTIMNMLTESIGLGGTERYSGMGHSSAYKGRGNEQARAVDTSLQSKAQPYGNFEGGKSPIPSTDKPAPTGAGLQIKSKKMSVPLDKSLVPNQGDATAPAANFAAGAAGESSKKKIKEDAETDTSLIKKGALLNKGPLQRLTNPEQPPEPPQIAPPKPSLSFQTPDLSGKKDDDELQTPKLDSKSNVKKLKGKVDTQMDKSLIAPVKKTGKTNQGQVIPTPSFGLPAAPATAQGVKPNLTAVKPTATAINPTAAVGSVTGPAAGDSPAPTDSLKPHKFNDQKQATSPVQAAGQSGISDKPNVLGKDAQKNTSTGNHAKAAQQGTERAHERRNDAVAGKTPATLPPLMAAATAALSQQAQAQTSSEPKKQDIFSADTPSDKTKSRVEFQPAADTPSPTNRGTRTGNDPEKDPGSIHRDKGATGPGAQSKRNPSYPDIPPDEVIWKRPPEYETWTQKQKDDWEKLEKTELPDDNPWLSAGLAAGGLIGVKRPRFSRPGPKISRPGDPQIERPGEEKPKIENPKEPKPEETKQKPEEKTALSPEQQKERQGNFTSPTPEETPKSKIDQGTGRPARTPEQAKQKQGEFSPKPEETPKSKIDQPKGAKEPATPEQAKKRQGEFTSPEPKSDEKSKIDQEPRTKPEEKGKPEETKPKDEEKPGEKPKDETKPKEEKPGEKEEKSGILDKLGWAGLGAGGLAMLKYLMGMNHDGAGIGGKKKGSQFVYGSQGQLRGLPTRQKGGGLESILKGMKEETENLDKVRRAVQLVGRRKSNNKDVLGRQTATQTRDIDENRRLQIMREALKEKQDKNKDKKLKPGEDKTPIDCHPKLKHEPTGHYTL